MITSKTQSHLLETAYSCIICFDSAEEIFLESLSSERSYSSDEVALKIQQLRKQILDLEKKKNKLFKKKDIKNTRLNEITQTETISSLKVLQNELEKLTDKTIVVIGHLHNGGSHTVCTRCFQSYIQKSIHCAECNRPFKISSEEFEGVLCQELTLDIRTTSFVAKKPLYMETIFNHHAKAARVKQIQGICITIIALGMLELSKSLLATNHRKYETLDVIVNLTYNTFKYTAITGIIVSLTDLIFKQIRP